MKGLLIKDFMTLKGQYAYYVALIALFALMPDAGAIMAPVMVAALPKAALAYDEQCRWDRLAGALPYTAAQLVLSKYALGLAVTLGAVALALAARAVEGLFMDMAQAHDQFMALMAMGLSANLLLQGITLPIAMRMGAERSRLLMMGVAAAVAVLFGFVVMDADVEAISGVAVSIFMLVALAVYLLSMPLSMRAYLRRHRA